MLQPEVKPQELTSQSSMEQWLSTFQTKCRQDFWWICNKDISTLLPGSTATYQSGWRDLEPVQRRQPEISNQREKSVRRRVEGATNLPGNWQQFLRIDASKAVVYLLGSTPHPPWNREASSHQVSGQWWGCLVQSPPRSVQPWRG